MSLSLTTHLLPSSTTKIFHHQTPKTLYYLTSNPKTHLKFPCFSSGKPRKISKKASDAELASELTAEVKKMKTQLEERENAVIQTRQMLFSDFCKFLNMRPDEVKNQWMKMNPDEKLGLVQGFVSDWGLNFHPLSPKSVRDLVEEFVMLDFQEEREMSNSSFTSDKLKKLIMDKFSPDY